MVPAQLLLNQIFNGLAIGLVFTLVALGLSIILGLLGVVNFAHGAFYMLGAYITWIIASTALGNFWIGVVVAAFVCAAVGLAVFFGIVRPLKDRPPLEPLLALVGLNIIFTQSARTIWGAEPKLMPIPLGTIKLELSGLSFAYPTYFILIIIICTAMLIAMYYLFRKSSLGIRCLACIQDRQTASALGVDINKVALLVFLIGLMVAGVGGGLVGPIFSVYPRMGTDLIGFLFTIVIIGGLGSIEGTLIGGILIVMTRSIASIFVPESVANIFAYIILLAILMVRPRGIRGYEKVLE